VLAGSGALRTVAQRLQRVTDHHGSMTTCRMHCKSSRTMPRCNLSRSAHGSAEAHPSMYATADRVDTARRVTHSTPLPPSQVISDWAYHQNNEELAFSFGIVLPNHLHECLPIRANVSNPFWQVASALLWGSDASRYANMQRHLALLPYRYSQTSCCLSSKEHCICLRNDLEITHDAVVFARLFSLTFSSLHQVRTNSVAWHQR
jgi:hypothetical protein